MPVAPLLAGWWQLTGGLPAQTRGTGEQPNGQPLTVELYVAGMWVDITSYVMTRDGNERIVIERGRRDEASQLDRATCRMQLNNRDGRFSPRNPTSPYYGLIGRNTPLRVSVPSGNAKNYRFQGEVVSWPQRWDSTGTDVWVDLEAAGILRRLAQGASALGSTMYRGLVTLAVNPPVAYWPCEDESGATVIASGLPEESPMRITGTPTLASYEGFASSKPLPLTSLSSWSGAVPPYTDTGTAQIRWLLHVPDAGLTDGAVIIRITASGTAPVWEMIYQSASGGSLTLRVYDVDRVEIATGSITGVDGTLLRVTVEMERSGSDILVGLGAMEYGASGAASDSGLLVGYTVGVVKRVDINPDGLLNDMAIGHISVHSDVTSILDLADELKAYDGETAGRRIERLCTEEQISFESIGDLDDTEAMGPQGVATLVDLLNEAAEADLGMLYETTSVLGLGYRARTSLYNQDAGLALDYTAAHLYGELTPVDDDLYTRNDVTVQRADGSSARTELTTGALSVLPPPAGVGRYAEQVTLNLETDERLPDHAGWRLHLGTADEARYPQLTVHLQRQVFTASTTLRIDTLSLRPGDRLTVANLPEWLPPADVSLLVLGFNESIDRFQHVVTFNGAPETPWHVAVVEDDTYGWVDTDGSELAEAVSSSATSLSVRTTAGEIWTTDSSDMPFDIQCGGEVMTVTAISGSSSPQTFTVTRSVNGIVKGHDAGTDVRLAYPAIVAL